MENIVEKYNIKINIKGLYCINDLVNNVIRSKNPNVYMQRYGKKERDKNTGEYYVDKKVILEIINTSRSKFSRDCRNILNDYSIKDNSIIDLKNNKFSFEGSDLTIIHNNNELWFRANNIAEILEYSNTADAISVNVDIDDKIRFEHINGMFETYTLLNQPQTIFINESGLYSLIMRSRMKAAKKFQRWVTKEVLPSIRQTGSYHIKQSIEKGTLPEIAYDLNDYIKKNCFYVIQIKDNLYKYGISSNMARRGKDHLANFNYMKIVKIFELDNFNVCREVENKVNLFVRQNKIHCVYDKINDKIYMGKDKKKIKNIWVEFFITNESYKIDDIILQIGKYTEEINELTESNYEYLIQKEKTKQLSSLSKVEEYRYKQLEIQKYLIDNGHTNNLVNNINEQIEEDLSDDSSIKNLISKNNKCVDCNTNIYKNSTRCNNCKNKLKFLTNTKNRPPYEQLQNDLTTMSMVKVGKKYGVSDNAVRKWIRLYKKYDNLYNHDKIK